MLAVSCRRGGKLSYRPEIAAGFCVLTNVSALGVITGFYSTFVSGLDALLVKVIENEMWVVNWPC